MANKGLTWLGGIGLGAGLMYIVDPKTQMDEDLARMKTFLETGTPSHDAAERRAEASAG